MNPLQFVILSIAAWRVTHLIQAEDGPWEVIFKIRKLAGTGFVGSLMDCFYCSSIWVAIPFGIIAGHKWTEYIYYSLAFSGSAMLIQKIFSMSCCNEKRAAWQEG